MWHWLDGVVVVVFAWCVVQSVWASYFIFCFFPRFAFSYRSAAVLPRIRSMCGAFVPMVQLIPYAQRARTPKPLQMLDRPWDWFGHGCNPRIGSNISRQGGLCSKTHGKKIWKFGHNSARFAVLVVLCVCNVCSLYSSFDNNHLPSSGESR